MRDLSRDFKAVPALAPAVRAGTATSGAIDRLGYAALTFAVHAGDWTNGTHTVSADASDDGSTWAAISAGELVGSFPVIASASDEDAVTLVGYIGDARFVRVKSTVTGAPATGAAIGAMVLLGRAAERPAA